MELPVAVADDPACDAERQTVAAQRQTLPPVVWLIAANWPGFALEGTVRSVLSALGIAVYAFLTAAEVWRDRRSRKHPYWQTVLMPLLHASVFLCPVLLPALIPGTAGNAARTRVPTPTLVEPTAAIRPPASSGRRPAPRCR